MSAAVSIRVWGDYACFSRPEMKVERVSYPIITPSAARGILEAIFWEPEMHYLIDHVVVVKGKKGNWFTFRRNEVQKVINIREAQSWMKGATPVKPIEAGGGAADAAQRSMLALAGVEYIITAEIRLTPKAAPPRDNLGKFLDLIRHRSAKGKCFHRPYLGCRELAADFDLVEDPTSVAADESFNDNLGLMLYDVFDPATRTRQRFDPPQPVFFDATVQRGRMDCHPERVALIRSGTGRN